MTETNSLVDYFISSFAFVLPFFTIYAAGIFSGIVICGKNHKKKEEGIRLE